MSSKSLSVRDLEVQQLLSRADSVHSFEGPSRCRTSPMAAWLFAAKMCRKPHSVHPSSPLGIAQLNEEWWRCARRFQLLSASSSCFISISGAATSNWFKVNIVENEDVITELCELPEQPEIAFLSHSQQHAIIVTAEENGNWLLLARAEGESLFDIGQSDS